MRLMVLIAAAAALFATQASAAEPVALYQPLQSCQACQTGKCGPVATAVSNATTYVGNVWQAVSQPACGVRRQPVRNAIRSLFGGCCR